MATILADRIKQLRELTGSSVSLCKKALEETNGDMDRARVLLQKSSVALAAKKSTRATKSGIIDSYIHSTKRVGVLIDLRCETDFVARNPEFQALAHDIALHIAGVGALYVSADQVPPDAIKDARNLFHEEVMRLGKSSEMMEKIIVGKLDAHFAEVSLLSQAFVKDPAFTIGDLIKSKIAHFGENIVVERFIRFEL